MLKAVESLRLRSSQPSFIYPSQATCRHERAAGLKNLLGSYLTLLADRLSAAAADIEAVPRIYAALGACHPTCFTIIPPSSPIVHSVGVLKPQPTFYQGFMQGRCRFDAGLTHH